MKNIKTINPEKIVETLELPKDLLLGFPLLTMNGNREVLIENHRGIVEYTSNQIIVLSKNLKIQFIGERLFIEYYAGDLMKVQGIIHQMNFLE